MKMLLGLLLLSSVALGKEKIDLNEIPEGFTSDLHSSLIGGEVVPNEDLPAVVRINSGNAWCSATIVGPQALLTAGHCQEEDQIPNPDVPGSSIKVWKRVSITGKTVKFSVYGKQYQAACTGSTLYPGKDHDIALCYISEAIPGLKYASIANAAPTLNEKILLMGYGCEESNNGRGRGGNDGKLRLGDAKVYKLSNEAKSNYDYVTVDKTALCFGDSGGPSMRFISDYRNQKHEVYGVNSKGDIKTISYLADLNTKASRDFYAHWIGLYPGVQICGVNLECNNGSEPEDNCDDEWQGVLEAINKWQECRKK